MAEFPELIRAIFLSKGEEKNAEQKAGMYTLTFCKNGMWQVLNLLGSRSELIVQVVRIDDYIPCTLAGGPVYSRGNGPELWVMLLEKAYAKVISPIFFTNLLSCMVPIKRLVWDGPMRL